MLNIKITGLEDVKRMVKKLESNARELTGDVKLNDLFTREFMLRYSSVQSLDALVAAGGFAVETIADFETDAWEEVVKKHTSFPSWNDMQQKAIEEYAKRKFEQGQ